MSKITSHSSTLVRSSHKLPSNVKHSDEDHFSRCDGLGLRIVKNELLTLNKNQTSSPRVRSSVESINSIGCLFEPFHRFSFLFLVLFVNTIWSLQMNPCTASTSTNLISEMQLYTFNALCDGIHFSSIPTCVNELWDLWKLLILCLFLIFCWVS